MRKAGSAYCSRRWVAIRLILLVLLASWIPSAAQQTRQTLSKSKKQLEAEIEYTNTLLEQTQKTRETSLNKLKLLNRQIDKREALINAIQRAASKLDNPALAYMYLEAMKKIAGKL